MQICLIFCANFILLVALYIGNIWLIGQIGIDFDVRLLR